jgi:aspartate 1-decarboxylase
MLKAKLHRGTVTGADLHYEGSVKIDRDLLDAADILEYEQVHVLDINNGERLITYAIPGERGSGEIVLNGAAARKVFVGDKVIIATFVAIDEAEALKHKPRVILLDDNNRIQTAHD